MKERVGSEGGEGGGRWRYRPRIKEKREKKKELRDKKKLSIMRRRWNLKKPKRDENKFATDLRWRKTDVKCSKFLNEWFPLFFSLGDLQFRNTGPNSWFTKVLWFSFFCLRMATIRWWNLSDGKWGRIMVDWNRVGNLYWSLEKGI